MMAVSRASKQAKQRRGLLSQGILVTSGYIRGLVALRMARFTKVHLFPPFIIEYLRVIISSIAEWSHESMQHQQRLKVKWFKLILSFITQT
jgi:hypothetical protein